MGAQRNSSTGLPELKLDVLYDQLLAALRAETHKLPVYPADHKVGMRVPEGGSNCDKCGHLSGPRECDADLFVEWNGSNEIPDKTSRYCCDFFEAKK